MMAMELCPSSSLQYQASDLLEAIKQENVSLVIRLLNAGLDPNTGPPRTISPLATAVRTKNVQLVDLLIQHGAHFTLTPEDYAFDHEELTELILFSSRRAKYPVLTAIHLNQTAIITTFLSHAKAKEHKTDIDPSTGAILLAVAFAKALMPTIEILIGFAGHVDLEKAFMLLQISMEWRRDPVITTLVLSTYLKDCDFLPAELSRSALFQAAAYGFLDVISFFLERGVDVNSALQSPIFFAEEADYSGQIRYSGYQAQDTPLLIAADRGQAEPVNLLLEQGASFSSKRRWRTINHSDRVEADDSVMDLAMAGLHAKVVHVLHRWGARWDSFRNIDSGEIKEKEESRLGPGEHLLLSACRKGNVDMVDILLKYGISPEVRGDDGKTPLLWAVSMGKVEVVRHLLKGGADLESTGPHFYDTTRHLTPLQWATHYGKSQIVDVLTGACANKNAMN